MYVAYTHNAVVVFFRDTDDDGKLSFVHDVQLNASSLYYGVDVASVIVSPDDNMVYVASCNGVWVFSRNADDNGKLSFMQAIKDKDGGVDGLEGARSIAVSPDGNNVYVASEYDEAIGVFSRYQGQGGKPTRKPTKAPTQFSCLSIKKRMQCKSKMNRAKCVWRSNACQKRQPTAFPTAKPTKAPTQFSCLNIKKDAVQLKDESRKVRMEEQRMPKSGSQQHSQLQSRPKPLPNFRV